MIVTVARLGHLGDGLATDETGTGLRVPMTLPGEVVEGDAHDGRLIEPRIVTPSPQRVRAPCPHYRACGGCSLQHASDPFVAEWKADVVRQALGAHGLKPVIRPVLTSPERSRRRAVLAGRKLRSGSALVGFHARASGTIVEIPDCILLRPELMALLPALRELIALGASRKGEVDLHVSLSAGRADVAVTGARDLDTGLRMETPRIASAHGIGRIAWNDEVVATPDAPVQIFGKARVLPPSGSFLQATDEGEAALLAGVREALGGASRIADLFAGCGTFSLPLAETVEVHAVEGDAAMTGALEKGWRATPGLHRLTAEVRDLFRRPLLPDELGGFDAVVIDPPRAGAEAQCREIAASRLARLAYVSCNPVTFARDAAILTTTGFALHWVQVVDQFRWSPHVELVASFGRV